MIGAAGGGGGRGSPDAVLDKRVAKLFPSRTHPVRLHPSDETVFDEHSFRFRKSVLVSLSRRRGLEMDFWGNLDSLWGQVAFLPAGIGAIRIAQGMLQVTAS